MISRFEKVVLIILAGLGAGYWGYGLLLVLMIPGEYADYFNKYKVLFLITNRVIGTGIFLLFELAIIKNWIRRRRLAWPLFFVILAVVILITYFFEGVMVYREFR